MSVMHREGNVFNTELPAIGHGVNTKGDMGSGIAATIREMYPSVNKAYKHACKTGNLNPGGHIAIRAEEFEGDSPRYILNIASQKKTGRNARYDYLEASMTKAFEWVDEAGLEGLALPEIGAGIGGLEWSDVLAIIENKSSLYPHLTVEVWSFNPNI